MIGLVCKQRRKMNYHNIKHIDMLNGNGLRVTLFVSGCEHECVNCQNSETWDVNSGIEFDINAQQEIFESLKNEYITGITFSGGDPIHNNNYNTILKMCKTIKNKFTNKTIWVYTGYMYEDLLMDKNEILKYIDVLVDGNFVEKLKNLDLQWIGSSNQRVVDVKKSLEKEKVILYNI